MATDKVFALFYTKLLVGETSTSVTTVAKVSVLIKKGVRPKKEVILSPVVEAP